MTRFSNIAQLMTEYSHFLNVVVALKKANEIAQALGKKPNTSEAVEVVVLLRRHVFGTCPSLVAAESTL